MPGGTMSEPEVKTFVWFRNPMPYNEEDMIASGWDTLGKITYGYWHVDAFARGASNDPKVNLWRIWKKAGFGQSKLDTEALHLAIEEVCRGE